MQNNHLPIDEKIDIELMSIFLMQLRASTFFAAIIIVYIAFFLYNTAPSQVVVIWLGVMLSIEGYVFYIAVYFKPSLSPQKIPSTKLRLVLANASAGAGLGAVCFLFIHPQNLTLSDYFLVCILVGVVAISACALSASISSLIAFTSLICGGMLSILLSNPTYFKWWFLILFALQAVTICFAWGVHQSIIGLIKARILNAHTANELDILNQKMEVVNQDLREKNQALKVTQAQLESLVTQDELTGLYNRRYILARLEKDLSANSQRGKYCCVALLDLDFFKQVNDRFGHAAGDSVLRSCASALEQELRQGEVLARFGGEEFLIYLPRLQLNEAQILAERLRQSIAKMLFSFEGQSLQITTSIGIAAYTLLDTPESLIDKADKALYHAKRKGRNRVEGQEA